MPVGRKPKPYKKLAEIKKELAKIHLKMKAEQDAALKHYKEVKEATTRIAYLARLVETIERGHLEEEDLPKEKGGK